MTAVTNAGPLIHLSWLGMLDLLPALFGGILVPEAVEGEALRAGAHVPGITALREAFNADWLSVRAVGDPGMVVALRVHLDPGESEAIALMREGGGDVLLLDDRRARTIAQQEDLAVMAPLASCGWPEIGDSFWP